MHYEKTERTDYLIYYLSASMDMLNIPLNSQQQILKIFVPMWSTIMPHKLSPMTAIPYTNLSVGR